LPVVIIDYLIITIQLKNNINDFRRHKPQRHQKS